MDNEPKIIFDGDHFYTCDATDDQLRQVNAEILAIKYQLPRTLPGPPYLSKEAYELFNRETEGLNAGLIRRDEP